MNIIKRLTYLALTLWLAAMLHGCAANDQDVSAAAKDAPNDGVALYSRICARCHGRLTNTTKAGRRPARIHSAIANNIGGMGVLKSLTDRQVNLIAGALAMVSPPENASGRELYGLYCASCHGEYDKSDIAGKTMADIKQAVQLKMCNAVNLQFLSGGNLVKIADSLQQAGQGGGK